MSFDRLLELASERERQSARQMADAARATLQQQQQLTMLQQYRLEYLQQLGARGKSGLEASSFYQLQQFLSRLDGLVVQQEFKVSQHQQAETARRQQWLNDRQQQKALAWLLEQREEKARKARERREQRDADEWVTQQWGRRAR